MESHQRMVSDKLSVGELMTTQMTALEPIMLVSKLEAVLKRCAHQAFPITTEVEKAFAASRPFGHLVLSRTVGASCLYLWFFVSVFLSFSLATAWLPRLCVASSINATHARPHAAAMRLHSPFLINIGALL